MAEPKGGGLVRSGQVEDAPVVVFVQQLLEQAIALNASDLHFEPYEAHYRVRIRIDGQLREVSSAPTAFRERLAARIKVLARLDVAEKRLPQDGRIQFRLPDSRVLDLRVSTLPTLFGEKVVVRVLDARQAQLELASLGYEATDRALLEQAIHRPHGMVLVTGPTGSGKSTTLYTFLSQLNSVHRRIVTIEDPVENKLPGIVQIPVKNEIGLTFASGLRSILRGDPNVVMVGEIRDLETAEIAVRASLTGHLVFSTLHTNDAVAGITRLIEMGVKPFLVSSAVRAFIAQRLVRCLCPACKEPANYKRDDFLKLGFPEAKNLKLYRAARGGCQQCRGTGYSGRVALYEIALMTPTMQTLVSERASEADLQTQARKDGFVPMREYGLKKAAAGVTTLEEVARVTSEEFE